MERFINKVLVSYGAAVEVRRGIEVIQTRAFLQPVRGTGLRYSQLNWTDLGGVPQGRYLYIGPAGVPLRIGDRMVAGGNTYIVRRAELLCAGNRPAYTWAICVRRGGDGSWKS